MNKQDQKTEKNGTKKETKKLTVCSFFLWLFLLMVAVTAIAVRQPVMTWQIRLIMASTFFLGFFVLLIYTFRLFTHFPKVIYPIIFIIALFITWTVLGGKSINKENLRCSYVTRLLLYENVPFRHGGETIFGIDASGLARTAFWQAVLKEGIREANPRVLGPQLWKLWWDDLSSDDILKQKDGYTIVIGIAKKLAGYDYHRLDKGDMAVIDPDHILIYLGQGKWIEASKEEKKVVIYTSVDDPKKSHLNKPVTFVRWRLLED